MDWNCIEYLIQTSNVSLWEGRRGVNQAGSQAGNQAGSQAGGWLRNRNGGCYDPARSITPYYPRP